MKLKVLVWVAVALVFAKVQCAASCAALACESDKSLPPCHQHHDGSKPAVCSHDAVVTRASVAQATQAVPAGELVAVTVFQTPLQERSAFGGADSTSPPGTARLSSVVLRI
jgi:hypothetical protein